MLFPIKGSTSPRCFTRLATISQIKTRREDSTQLATIELYDLLGDAQMLNVCGTEIKSGSGDLRGSAKRTHSRYSARRGCRFSDCCGESEMELEGRARRSLLTTLTSQPVVSSWLAGEITCEDAVIAFDRSVAKSQVVTAFAKCAKTLE